MNRWCNAARGILSAILLAASDAGAADLQQWDGCYAGTFTVGDNRKLLTNVRIENGRVVLGFSSVPRPPKEGIPADLKGEIDPSGWLRARGQHEDATIDLAGMLGGSDPSIQGQGQGTRRKIFSTDQQPVAWQIEKVAPLLADEATVRLWRERSSSFMARFGQGLCKAVHGPIAPVLCGQVEVRIGDRMC